MYQHLRVTLSPRNNLCLICASTIWIDNGAFFDILAMPVISGVYWHFYSTLSPRDTLFPVSEIHLQYSLYSMQVALAEYCSCTLQRHFHQPPQDCLGHLLICKYWYFELGLFSIWDKIHKFTLVLYVTTALTFKSVFIQYLVLCQNKSIWFVGAPSKHAAIPNASHSKLVTWTGKPAKQTLF